MFAAAALAIGPVLAASGAATAAPANQAVEFSGGSVLNMLVCRSTPSTSKLTVPAESRVTFVNRLGQNATLRIDGRTVTSVGANQAVPVVFHYGPVSVSMTISCNAGVVEEFNKVTVVVTPRAAAPAPTAASSGSNSSGSTSRGASGASSARGATATRTATLPAAGAEAAASADPWAPAAGQAASGAPSVAGAAGAEGAAEPAGVAAAEVGGLEAAAGEPVHGPSGLLAMIATVLSIGVGVAAVRAIIARRTSRAQFA
jgi:hypothetical protein